MSSKRTYFVMIGLVAVLSIGIIASVVLGDRYLQKQAGKLNELKVQDKILEEQQTALTQANKDIAKYSELEKISKSVVPQDKDQAKAVLEIIEIARQSGITIQSVTFPASNLGTKVAPAPKAEGDSAPAAPAAPPISQAKPVDGVPGVYSLEMNITPVSSDDNPISYYQFIDFLSRLENNRRTAQVTQIRVAPLTTARQSPFISFTLTINIFLKP